MINQELINYLHSVYPELPIDISYIKGYSTEEIAKIERLYNVKITGQLYDFLLSIGRCSGGFFGDDPLIFYREQKTVRSHFLSQYGLWDDLRNIQQFEYCDKKPFLIFGDDPLIFYREQKTVRSHFLSQYGLWDDLRNIQQFEYCDKKPFLISIESETLYFFLLTESDHPDLVYSYDENEETIKATKWTFNEYLRRVINSYTRNYKIQVTPDQYGELINI